MNYPVKNMSFARYPKGNLMQGFGESPELYKTVCPLPGKCLGRHNGLDIVAPWGTPILATTTQKIVEVKNDANGYGMHIRAIDADYEYTYGHLSKIFVKVGEVVLAGTHIGNMGNTGFVVSGATPYWKYNPYRGTHLHYQERRIVHRIPGQPVGPGTWMTYSSGDNVQILNYDNGFFGAVDLLPRLLALNRPPENEAEVRALQLTVISLANQLIEIYKKLIAVRLRQA
jgi:murein DD-endopeptidase MepM/ murein hydrolase activator NlpD